jgi:type II secretory pathway pseudopilin PulG
MVKRIVHELIHDDRGIVVSTELVLVATLAVVALIAGLTAIRDAVVSELSDVAGGVQRLNQSYSTNGLRAPSAYGVGSDFQDATDFCDTPGSESGVADNCIRFDAPSEDERPWRRFRRLQLDSDGLRDI